MISRSKSTILCDHACLGLSIFTFFVIAVNFLIYNLIGQKVIERQLYDGRKVFSAVWLTYEQDERLRFLTCVSEGHMVQNAILDTKYLCIFCL